MKLSEVFTQLTYGELSQLSLGGASEGTINSSNYKQVVQHVNLGLLALYKRFPLKEGRVAFNLQAGKFTYPLDTRDDVVFLESAISDEFTDNILKIERVYTEKGFELALNDSADPLSCFTPSNTVLRVAPAIVAASADLPELLRTATLSVVYRAMHPIITVTTGFSPSRVELELPYTHLEPLLYFVASRVNNPIGMSNEFHAGNSYAAKYEKACQELEMVNLRVDQGSQNTRLERAGWV